MNKYLGTENKDLILDGEEDNEEDDENEKDVEDPLHIYDDEEEEEKISGNCKNNSKEKPEPSILDNLTPCDVRVLINTEVKINQRPNYKNLSRGLNLRRGSKIVWFHLNCIHCFKIQTGAQSKPLLCGFKKRFKFIKFGL